MPRNKNSSALTLMFALRWLIFYELEHGFDPRRLITTENVPSHHRDANASPGCKFIRGSFWNSAPKNFNQIFYFSFSSMVRVKKNSHSFHDAIIETFKNMRSQWWKQKVFFRPISSGKKFHPDFEAFSAFSGVSVRMSVSYQLLHGWFPWAQP